jgi:hypothetical protein
MHISGDSDDLGGFWVDAANPKALADRVLPARIPRPEPPSQTFVNNGHTLRVFRILFGKLPSASSMRRPVCVKVNFTCG